MNLAQFTVVLVLLAIAASSSFATPTQQPGAYQGRSAEWWAGKTTHWKKAAVKRGCMLTMVKRTTRPTLDHGIQLAATTYHLSASALRRVAYCESGGFLYAHSSGGHKGPFQFADSTWRSTPYGGFSVYDPIAAPLATGWMWRQGRKGEWACR